MRKGKIFPNELTRKKGGKMRTTEIIKLNFMKKDSMNLFLYTKTKPSLAAVSKGSKLKRIFYVPKKVFILDFYLYKEPEIFKNAKKQYIEKVKKEIEKQKKAVKYLSLIHI